jgi:hypothetical protein
VAINRQANLLNVYFVGNFGYNGQAEDIPGRALVVLNAVATNGTTLPHEVGHCLDLYHTHEAFFGHERINRDDLQNCSANCSTAGDLLCDTAADPYNNGFGLLGNVNANCQWTGSATDPCGNTNYTPDPRNYMSYGAQCRNHFTDQQIERMHYALVNKVSDLITIQVTASNEINGANVVGSTLDIAGQTLASGSNISLLDGDTYDGKTNHERFNNDKRSAA